MRANRIAAGQNALICMPNIVTLTVGRMSAASSAAQFPS
jgi:hypothetical protein